MEEKKSVKIRLTVLLVFCLIIIIGLGYFSLNQYAQKNTAEEKVSNLENQIENLNEKIANQTSTEKYNNSVISNNTETENSTPIKQDTDEGNDDNFIVLYDGYEISKKAEIKTIYHADNFLLDKDNLDKYNTTYYNYSQGKFEGTSIGNVKDYMDDWSYVSNIGSIAISKNYNAIPRKYTKVYNFPTELSELYNKFENFQLYKIDLDGDGKDEYLYSYREISYRGEDEITNSTISLLDNNLNIISDLVYLESDVNIELSLDKDINIIDIDDDGVMEILIDVPGYEWFTLDVLKYDNGILQGEKEEQLYANWKYGP